MTMEKTCREFESQLARAADGATDLADGRGREAFDRHLAACAACRQALVDQRAVREALQARPTTQARSDFAMAVMAAIETERPWLERLDFRLWTWRLAPVAAALSLATWLVVQQTSELTTPTVFDEDLPVSAALYQESVTDVSVLSLLLRASPDDRLVDSYKEPQ